MTRRRTPKPEVLEREAQVVRLRRQGMTWDMISEQVGYASASAAHWAYQRAAKRVVQEDIDAIRRIETERLDIAQSAIWSRVLNGELQAVQTFVRIQERRAKLLGLDQPFKQQVEITTYDASTIDSEIARLVQFLNSGTQGALDAPTSTTEPTTT
jgi:hypothetical protein